MSRKFILGIGVAFAAIFAVAVAAVVGANSISTAPVQTVAASPESVAAPVAALASAPAEAAVPRLLATAAPELHPAPIGSTYVVQDSDLAPLAEAVKLSDPNSGVSKEIWARETPIAQKLLGGLCDCDQRNWLKHFVDTGKKAMSGSDDYPQSVQLLSKLRRSNADLGKGVAHP